MRAPTSPGAAATARAISRALCIAAVLAVLAPSAAAADDAATIDGGAAEQEAAASEEAPDEEATTEGASEDGEADDANRDTDADDGEVQDSSGAVDTADDDWDWDNEEAQDEQDLAEESADDWDWDNEEAQDEEIVEPAEQQAAEGGDDDWSWDDEDAQDEEDLADEGADDWDWDDDASEDTADPVEQQAAEGGDDWGWDDEDLQGEEESEDDWDWGDEDTQAEDDGDDWDWDDEGDSDGGSDAWSWDEEDGGSWGDDDVDWDAIDEAIEAETDDEGDAPSEETDWDAIWGDEDEEVTESVAVPTDLTGVDAVRGVIVDDEFEQPIVGASVTIDGMDLEQTTGPDGVFFFDLEPGEYTIRMDHGEYSGAAYAVLIEAGEVTDLANVRLRNDELVITVVSEGRAIQGSVATQIAERQESTTVQDAIGEEQFSRSTDGSASSAVRRVVGVTIEDGRFLVVRGLGGRRNLVTLNGVPVPKTDPDYPAAELDIFPTDLLSNITLTKNPSAERFGSFVGGLMDIETRAYPEELELSLGLSVAGTTVSTFREHLLLEGGGTDFLGFDGGARALPGSIPSDTTLSFGGLTGGLQDADEYERIVDAFPQNWAPRSGTALPALGLEFSLGNSLETRNERDIGYLFSFTYGISQGHSERQRGSVSSNDEGTTRNANLEGDAYSESVKWGTLANLSFELASGHDLRLVSLFNQTSKDQYIALRGNDGDNDSGALREEFSWQQRSLSFNQILGRHRRLLPSTSPWHETRIDWRGSFAWARRFEPDTHYFTSVQGVWDINPGSGEHFTSDLVQTDAFGGLQLELPYLDKLKLRFGGDVSQSDREYESRRFRYTLSANADRSTDFLSQGGNELFTPDNVGLRSTGASIVLQEVGSTGNAYRSSQFGAAGFGQFDWSVVERFRLTGGGRAELFEQTITPLQFGTRAGDRAQRSDFDLLPSGSAIAEMADDFFLRLVYGASVARPQVREVAPFVYQDYPRRRTVTGNPDLNREFVHNLDARFEYFPSMTEVIALSLYTKRFRSPITSISDRQGAVQYLNADSAELYGAELELQFEFDRFGAEGLLFSTNVSLTRSSLERPCPDENADGDCDFQFTNRRSRLGGQAPWMVNSSFGYAAPDGVWSAFAYYNVIGPRIENFGTNGLPDSLLEPSHELDLTASYRFHEDWKVKLSFENLALARDRETQGGLSVAEDFEGLEIGASLSWSPRIDRD